VSRAGKDSIDHAPGGHDDKINSIAGSLALATRPQGLNISEEALRALSHLARRGSLVESYRLAKSLILLNPSSAVGQVMSSKKLFM
jgi:hypothetical protein